MKTRREFLTQTVAASMVVATAVHAKEPPTEASTTGSQAHRKSPSEISRIKSVVRRDETILRLGGDGGTGPITWTADDRQVVAGLDGAGWPGHPPESYFASQLGFVSGEPQSARFENVPGYPGLSLWDSIWKSRPFYYSGGILAVDGSIYQFLSTWKREYASVDESPWAGTEKSLSDSELRMTAAKLIYSRDNGRTWRNQNGTSPVVWEKKAERSRKTMAFFEEPQAAFSSLTFLQMGRGYQDNRDGYVYVYGANGNSEGAKNEIVTFRVPKAKVTDRSAYEYFAGRRVDGRANWVTDINARAVVHTFPGGSTTIPLGWALPSVVFNAPLGLYIMVNGGQPRGSGGQDLAGKPTCLGLWAAQHPWGPWSPIHEEVAWMPAGDPGARPIIPQIAPKWISRDGRSFWLVWTDLQPTRGFGQTFGHKDLYRGHSPEEFVRDRVTWRQYHPYFAFNTQRVDLLIA